MLYDSRSCLCFLIERGFPVFDVECCESLFSTWEVQKRVRRLLYNGEKAVRRRCKFEVELMLSKFRAFPLVWRSGESVFLLKTSDVW